MGKAHLLKQSEQCWEIIPNKQISTLLKNKEFDSIRNDVARLKGARFVSAVESGINDHLDEVLIKQLTGKI